MLNTYQCGDGEWISMNATHHWDVTWPALCNFVGRPDLIDKYPNYEDTCWEHAEEVTAIFDEEFKKFTRDEVYEGLKACGTISIEKASHSIDVIKDEQALANGFVVPFVDVDGKEIMHPTTPLRFGDNEPAPLLYGSKLGEHTKEIMTMLGYSEEKIQEYIDNKIVVAMAEYKIEYLHATEGRKNLLVLLEKLQKKNYVHSFMTLK